MSNLSRVARLNFGEGGGGGGPFTVPQTQDWLALAQTPSSGILRTVNVSNTTQLNAALADATAGDDIILANGTYTATTFTISNKPGTSSNKIILRAANMGQATINGNVLYEDSGHWHFDGIDFKNCHFRLDFGTDAGLTTFSFCKWKENISTNSKNALQIKETAALNALFCEFIDHFGAGIITSANTVNNCNIAHCLFDNTNVTAEENGTECLSLGTGFVTEGASGKHHVENCRITGWNSDDEVVTVKSTNNVLIGVTIRSCNGRVAQRFGSGNRFEAFNIDDSHGLRIAGADAKVFSTTITNTVGTDNRGLIIAAGDVAPGANGHAFARDTRVSGCNCDRTAVGEGFSGDTLDAVNTKFYDHTGTITLGPDQSGTDQSDVGNPDPTFSFEANYVVPLAEIGRNALSL